MLELKDLCAGYPKHPVLDRVTLTIAAGQITVIAGPNGCGKSTLLKVISGGIPRSGGQILLDGRDLADLCPQELARQVAYLPQSRPVPEITAFRLVLHGRFPYLSYPRHYGPRDLEAAREALDRMGIADLADRPMATLSGGQRQKVWLSMVLAQDTPVVLLDEPTTFLDISHQLQLMEQARFLAREGKAVVLVLHDLAMALQCADSLAIFMDGRLLQQGSPDAVFSGGCLEQAFGVAVRRVQAPEGWQYYYHTN